MVNLHVCKHMKMSPYVSFMLIG